MCLVSVNSSMWADFKILIGICDVPSFGSRLAGTCRPNFLSYATKRWLAWVDSSWGAEKYWNNHLGNILTLQGLGMGTMRTALILGTCSHNQPRVTLFFDYILTRRFYSTDLIASVCKNHADRDSCYVSGAAETFWTSRPLTDMKNPKTIFG